MMKNLINKLGVSAMLAASALYSGCATTAEGMRQEQEFERKMLGAILGAGIVQRGAQVGSVGAVVLGQGVVDASLQQPQVVINNPPQYPQQPVNYPSAQPANTMPAAVLNTTNSLKLMHARDLNGDNIISANELFGEKYSFNPGDLIAIHISNNTGNDRHVKFFIYRNGATVYTSDFLRNNNGHVGYNVLSPVGQNTIVEPGDYEVSSIDNYGRFVDRKIFTVNPSTVAQTGR